MADRTYRMSLALYQQLQNSKYTNNDPISYNETIPYIFISDWTNIKALDKLAIDAEALAEGYSVES